MQPISQTLKPVNYNSQQTTIYNSFNNRVFNNHILETNDYRQEAAVHISSETHGGEDVAIYGHGPMSYLYDG